MLNLGTAMSMNIKSFIAALLLVLTLGTPAQAAIDKFGGDDRVKNPASRYFTANATSVGQFTVTQAGAGWALDQFAGDILQADTSREVYWAIIGNTEDTITVAGQITDNTQDDFLMRLISDENDGTEEFAVLDHFNVQKVNGRWWHFTPMGNSFWMKGLNAHVTNAFNIQMKGYGFDGKNFYNSMNDHPVWGGQGATYAGMQLSLGLTLDQVKLDGFNWLGESADSWLLAPGGPSTVSTVTPSRYMPFTVFLWLKNTTQTPVQNVELWKPCLNLAAAATKCDSIYDAAEADFQAELTTAFRKAPRWYIFGDHGYAGDKDLVWQDKDLTPYKGANYNLWANPWVMGIKWDEEPTTVVSQFLTNHLGYFIAISPDTSARKRYMLEYLLADYNGGDLHLDGVYADITALNTAWGCSYADNAALLAEDGSTCLDTLLTFEPNGETTISECRPSYDGKAALWAWEPCDQHSLTPTLMADLDGVAESFWRLYTKGVHDALDDPTITQGHLLNYGPGYHGGKQFNSTGVGASSPHYLFRGSVSADGSEPYIDVMAVGNVAGVTINDPDQPYFHSVAQDYKDLYEFHGRPYFSTSTWITAESDSGVYPTGTVSAVTNEVLTSSGQMGFRLYTGQVSSNVPYQLIDSSVSFGVTGATGFSPSMSDGLFPRVFDTILDTTEGQLTWLVNCPGESDPILDTGLKHVLCLNDDIFTGGETYEIYGASSFEQKTDAKIICNSDHPLSEWVWYDSGFATSGSERAGNNFQDIATDYSTMIGPGFSWSSGPADFTAYCEEGDTFYFIYPENMDNYDGYKYEATPPVSYVPLTQEARAAQYVKYINEMTRLRASNGDYIFAGFSHWSYFDFGPNNYQKEKRNFGLYSHRLNRYDGSATTANGEIQDCGDFTTLFTGKLNSLYDDIYLIDAGSAPPAPTTTYFLMQEQ